MDFKDIIKAHLDKMAAQDPAFAERYALESKNLDSCIQYIFSEAQKQIKGKKTGCVPVALERDVVYGWAVHYYQEDNVVIEKTNVKKVVAPKAEKPKEVKPIKALVSDKKNKGKCMEMDLFAGMF